MGNNVDAAEFLTAIIKHGAPEPTGAVERLGDDKVFALIAAASMIAIGRKFDDSTPPARIQEYVADLKSRFAENADDIKPVVAEAVIRATLGEAQLLEGVDQNDIVSMMFLLTYAIMSHEQLDEAAETAFVDEVIAMSEGRTA